MNTLKTTFLLTMVFSVLCLSLFGHVLAIRSEKESLFTQGVFSNKYLVGAAIMAFILQMATMICAVFQPYIQDRAPDNE